MEASTPFQPTQFNDIRIYEMPNLMLTQFFEGELWGNIYNNLFDHNRLAPNERQTYVDYLKKDLGTKGGPMMNWAIDTFTDPMVLLMLGLTPGAGTALRRGAGAIFQPIKANYVQKNASKVGTLGLLTGFQIFRRAPQISEALLGIRNVQKGILEANSAILEPEKQALIKMLKDKHGLRLPREKGLDPQSYAKGSKEREILDEINDAVHARLYGLDRKQTWDARIYQDGHIQKTYREVPRSLSDMERGLQGRGKHIEEEIFISTKELKDYRKKFPGGNPTKGVDGSKFSKDGSKEIWIDEATGEKVYREWAYAGTANRNIEVTHRAIAGKAHVDSTIEQFGLQKYLASHEEVLAGNFLRLFGKDDLMRMGAPARAIMETYQQGKIPIAKLIDTDKIGRMYRGRKLRVSNPDDASSQAENFLQNFFATSFDDIANVAKNEAELVDEVLALFHGQLKRGSYFPTSATTLLDDTGRIIKEFKPAGSAKAGPTITPMGSVLQKVHSGVGSFNREYYERLLVRAQAAGDSRMVKRLEQHIENLETRAAAAYQDPVSGEEVRKFGGVLGVNPNVERTMVKYLNQASQTYASYVAGTSKVGGRFKYDPAVWKYITDGQRRYSKNLDAADASALVREGELTQVGSVFEDMASNATPWGGHSMADVLEQAFVASANPFDREVLRTVIWPRMMGRKSLDETAASTVSLWTKEATNKFVQGPLAKAISEKGGDLGKRLINQMKVWSSPENLHMGRAGFTGGATKFLYATHLGFNPASVLLNIFQPLLLTSAYVGAPNVLKAYGQAFKELGGYLKERHKQIGWKVNPTPLERREIIKKSFRDAKNPNYDILGIMDDVYENVDALTFAANRGLKKSTAEYMFLDFPLKGFEKGEWLNRLVTANAVRNAYKGAVKKGQIPASAIKEGGELHVQMMRDMRDAVVETQFGSGFMNTPLLFMETFGNLPLQGKAFTAAKGFSQAGLSNPLIRQFLQFPTRMTTGALYTPSQVGGGVRTAFGRDMQLGHAGAAAFDIMRGLGISAVTYHAAKDILGIDLERGLYPEAVMAAPRTVGATITGEEYEMFKPPIVDVTLNAAKWLTTGDKEALGRSLPRLMPGGIQIQRALGTMSDQSGTFLGDLVSNFQKTYVDWDNPTSDGYVPMYKGDGTLIAYENPTEVILSGMGVDMGGLKEKQSDISAYLAAQRPMILEERRRYLSKLFANDIPGANEVASEFEDKWGIPLSVTKRHLDAYSKSRILARDERMLDRMPTDMRHLYAGIVASRAQNMGLPTEAFEKPTATQRSKVAQRPELNLNPMVLKELQRLVDEEKRSKGKTGPFDPYHPPFYGG